jgi:preprotein translocase subunit SecG
MFTTLIVFQVLIAIGLIAIVLVQRGPGATMGAAFGAGASGTVFGSRGAGNFLTRTTGWLALGFFSISLTLAVLATGLSGDDGSSLAGSVMQQQAAQQQAAEDQAAGIDAVIETLESGADQAPADAAPVEPDADAEQAAEDDGSGG